MSDESKNANELNDRLLDQALQEVIGGEAPSDLSQQILTAARQQTSQLSTPANGDEAMNSKRKPAWLTLAVAATLLLAMAAWMLPARNASRLAVHRSQPTERQRHSNVQESEGEDKMQMMAEPHALAEQTETPVVGKPGLFFEGEALKEQASRPSKDSDAGIRMRIDASPESLDQSTSSPARRWGYGGGGGALGLGRESVRGEPSEETFHFGLGFARGKSDVPYVGRRFRHLGEAGTGPRASGDQYTRIYENPFIVAEGEKAVSTFSIDVDTASYANVRQFLMQSGQLPPPDAVRIEELVNYFDYDYSGPTSDVPFAAHVEVASCPWHPEHRLVRVGIKGREIERQSRPQSNLVFLIDVSGSMNEPAKLPLLVEGMKLLTRELGENDRVAIVVYASSEGLALPSTRGDQQDIILAALENLRAGGSTAGGAGIQLAYQTAQDHFIDGGVNRVILATDGDFNVGTTSTAELERMAEQKAKDTGVFLTVLGFGRGNLNDAMMEAISGKGNGNYHYVDNRNEARKVLVDEMAGTLVTIAKDVKLQIEFNPAQVAGYRLIGYENRMLRTEDFNDDKKDAGEIGAGHTVTALYEIVPAGKSVGAASVDPLKYQTQPPVADGEDASGELLTLKIRYKQPDGDKSTKLEFPITDVGGSFAEATGDLKFAAAVASFGMLLRDSEHRGQTSYSAVLEIAEEGRRRDPHDYRAEFLQLVRRAKELAGE